MDNTVYSVKQLNGEIRTLLESSYRSLWVEGEVSGLVTPKSGHLYFTLKEADSVIRCAFFRNRQTRSGTIPVDGMQALIRGQISYYEPRGDLQLIVHHVEDAGEGVLRRAFEMLKKKLDAEGLFDHARKLPLPAHPAAIGVITSDSGAALHDVLVTLKRRYPLARVLVYPTLVQGDQAPESITEALNRAEIRAETDVLLLVRGGGSLEDLQAFNDERVAREIFRCTIPLITGIGHEIDFTISDFVADARAATPTAAAEMATPSSNEILAEIGAARDDLFRQAIQSINRRQQTLDLMQSRLVHPGQRLVKYIAENAFMERTLVSVIRSRIENELHRVRFTARSLAACSPLARVELIRQRVLNDQGAMLFQVRNRLDSLGQSLANHAEKVQLMNPQHTLDRGYAIVQNRKKEVITGPEQVKPGQDLDIRVSRGSFGATVEKS